jgi:hypothetical protein
VQAAYPHGGAPDRIAEAEAGFSMLDKDDDLMKICPGTAPEGREPNGAVTAGLGR